MRAPAIRSFATASMNAQSLTKPEDDFSAVIVGGSMLVLVLDLSAIKIETQTVRMTACRWMSAWMESDIQEDGK